MNISKWTIVWKYLTGGVGSVADYLLEILNVALAAIDVENKSKIQAVLNTAERVLSALTAFKWLCPTKWQTAYAATIEAVQAVIDALSDLQLTAVELTKVKNAFALAVAAWESPDDATCVDCDTCDTCEAKA